MSTDKLGFGAAMHYLGGGSPKSAESYYGRKIVDAQLGKSSSKYNDDLDTLFIKFEDGVEIEIFDDGQTCCERRYMTCDDEPKDLVGGILTRIEAKDGPMETDEEDEKHEQVFVEIATDKIFITLVTHNEHNGYYGGFELSIVEVGKESRV